MISNCNNMDFMMRIDFDWEFVSEGCARSTINDGTKCEILSSSPSEFNNDTMLAFVFKYDPLNEYGQLSKMEEDVSMENAVEKYEAWVTQLIQIKIEDCKSFINRWT